MDFLYLAQLHSRLCDLHNDLSHKIVGMASTDRLYVKANETADILYTASNATYELLRLYDSLDKA